MTTHDRDEGGLDVGSCEEKEGVAVLDRLSGDIVWKCQQHISLAEGGGSTHSSVSSWPRDALILGEDIQFS